ncbi:NHL repeat-containing protein 2 [Hordeum vulgare]|nr:NHL repeat-containing protein 2 [Hordeum vulgare]
MTASDDALGESLSMKMKHALSPLVAASQSRRASRIEAVLPANSPEVAGDENDTMMETGSNDTAPAPASLVHFDFIMEQAHAHYNTVKTEV